MNKQEARKRSTKRVSIKFPKTGRTLQSAKDECDVNKIMAKYTKNGLITHLKQGTPISGDFTQITDYQTAMNQIAISQQMFMELPAKLRQKFQNDPAQFISFVEDPKNKKEMIELGLALPERNNQDGKEAKDEDSTEDKGNNSDGSSVSGSTSKSAKKEKVS